MELGGGLNELGGGRWSWVELGGGGWSWVELGAWFSNIRLSTRVINIYMRWYKIRVRHNYIQCKYFYNI